jgi:hypothetical protein
MGTDAEVFQFDYQSYVSAVVPVFIDLLRNGRVSDWLQPLLERRQMRSSVWDKTDLARFLPLLRSDLSWDGPYDLEWTYDYDWRRRCSFAAESPERAPSEETAEQINWLFKTAVSVKCLERGQFVGRSRTVSQYSEMLPQLGVPQEDPISTLLAALGKRGFIIGYQFGAGFEGINGWLDQAETAELAKRLEVLPLPRYDVSFAAMEHLPRLFFRRAESIFCSHDRDDRHGGRLWIALGQRRDSAAAIGNTAEERQRQRKMTFSAPCTICNANSSGGTSRLISVCKCK